MQQVLTHIERHHWVAIALLGAIIATLLLNPLDTNLSQRQYFTAGLILAAVVLFATSALPEYVTALLLMAGAMLLELAPAQVVFSGFASTACWLIFAGLVIGIAINTTGLDQRVAGLFSARLTASYPLLITTTVVVSMLVGFLMPSSIGRAVLLIPIAMAVADRCGFLKSNVKDKTTSNGRIGVALAAAFGCHIPTFAILPANVPNMVFIGAAETIYQWTPAYASYLWLHFPILGIVKAAIIIALIVKLYPDTPKQPATESSPAPLSSPQKRLIIFLLITLSLWVTDTLHHISAAWIGLATACMLLLPGVGLVDKKAFNSQFNIGSLLFVVGILSLGTLINHSGLGQLVGDQFNRWLPLDKSQPFISFMTLALTAAITAIFTTLPGVPAVLTPFAEQMSHNSGFSLDAVLMTQVLGFSTVIFPFQSAPLVVAMQLSGVSLLHAARLCLILTAICVLVLFPLDYLWWQWLGWLS